MIMRNISLIFVDDEVYYAQAKKKTTRMIIKSFAREDVLFFRGQA